MTKGQLLEKVLRAWHVVPHTARLHLNWAEKDDPVDGPIDFGARPRYLLAANGKSITCLTCGLTSYNANDVREKYCGACHKFHEEK